VQARAAGAARIAGLVFIAAFAAAGIWIATGIEGYRVMTMPSADASFVPLAKTVERAAGAWLTNYRVQPWTIAAPVVAFGAAALALVASGLRRAGLAFVLSSVAVAAVILTAGLAMFPFVMPTPRATRRAA
jgi:cytochrome d ubiquinol oxidase subunit II